MDLKHYLVLFVVPVVVMCNQCAAQGPVKYCKSINAPGKAIYAWNERYMGSPGFCDSVRCGEKIKEDEDFVMIKLKGGDTIYHIVYHLGCWLKIGNRAQRGVK